MLGRMTYTILILFELSAVSLAQARVDPEVSRSTFDSQFSALDTNDDDLLDETEAAALAAVSTLAQLRMHGLTDVFPISRDDFVTAGVNFAMAHPTEPAKPSESKEDPLKAASTKKVESIPTIVPLSRSTAKKGHQVPELPSEYAALDKNGDGQIGLYEWERKRYAEFAKLDKNGDGFLTPVELMTKESLKLLYSRSARETTDPAKAANPGTPTVLASAAGGTPAVAVPTDAMESEARSAFTRLDDNKDGQIDETEWARSRTTRQMMEANGTKVSIPIKIDPFIASYRTAKATTATVRR